ncbi:MAG: polysaccharide biosynthesis C-terminal domain-containing protein [Bacteroidia bacterium]
MGIIEKQATRSAIYSYVGVGLGFFTILWLSYILSPQENGAMRTLVSYSVLFAQFAHLGFPAVTNRFFPYFRNKENGHHGFLFYAMVVASIGCFFALVVFLLLQDKIVSDNISKSPLFVTHLFYIVPLSVFMVFFYIFDSYLRANFNSVIGPLTKDLIQRVLILIIIFLYYLNLFDFDNFIMLYIIVNCFPTIVLLFFIIYIKEWHVKPTKYLIYKQHRVEMIKLGMYSILTSGTVAIISQIDAIMINKMLGEAKTGVYGIAFYFGTIILIPAHMIYRVSAPVVAELLKSEGMSGIHSIYKKSCNIQFTIGLLLFIGIWLNINNIMQILPDEYVSGKNVILVLTIGYLLEMATGINQVIILNSKYYRYDAYIIAFSVVLVVVSNYILIPIYGIIGSAIATAITFSINNILRLLFLYLKFNMQPYDSNTIKLGSIAVVVFLSGYFIPNIENTILDIAIRSGVVSILFVFLILKTESSPELNSKIRKNLKRLSINI